MSDLFTEIMNDVKVEDILSTYIKQTSELMTNTSRQQTDYID